MIRKKFLDTRYKTPSLDRLHNFVTLFENGGIQPLWVKSCYYISSLGHPAASVPCGFTPEGLPVGLQIVGRHHDDLGVLQLAYAFEQATKFGERLPGVLS